MNRRVPPNFQRLAGAVSLDGFDPARLRAECRTLQQLGYQAVYPNDLFFTIAPASAHPDPATVLLQEDTGFICAGPVDQVREVRALCDEHQLAIESAHFTQMLPPPGEPVDWIFPRHDRLVDLAQAAGLRFFTTHIGWMYGIANEAVMGDAARRYRQHELSLKELCALGRDRYGRDQMRADSLVIYRRLCDRAARAGIAVTIETACLEWLELNTRPADLRAFISEVGAPNLGVCVDCGHCHCAGLDPARIIQELGGLFWETHYHDNHGQRDEHLPVGAGTVNWPALIQAMQTADYAGTVTFEQADHATNANAWRRLLATAGAS